MSTVKFINEIISIYFSARTFRLWVDQCYLIFHWSWNFWEMFSLISFLKNFSRTKCWWREELQLPVTVKRSFSSSYKWKNCSSDIGSFDSFRSKFFAKSSLTFWIIFTKWIWFANSSNCFYDRNVWPPRQRAEIRERIASD